ncbi:hypothetical protein [Breoghania sp.]|uniref:hypothetical protein n=1 Tax=Breoghania sp. TaxID=2065378 RepID=UPI002AA70552|nr:hypothetical protein [Breoghania sp.]
MAFKASGFNKINEIGSIGTGKGSVKNKHGYVTPDDAATVETAGYFDEIADQLNVGDQLDISLGVPDAPALKLYIVTTNVAPVAIAALTTA